MCRFNWRLALLDVNSLNLPEFRVKFKNLAIVGFDLKK